MIFNLFKKRAETDQREILEKSINMIESMLQAQVAGITGSLAPRNSLPKDNWIYGYIYGFVDSFFQSTALKNNEDAWIEAEIRIFQMFYGEEEGNVIGRKSIDLLKKKEKYFMEGCLKAGQEIKTFLKTEDSKESPLGLIFYMAKKNKK
jgi:hypothetical protein